LEFLKDNNAQYLTQMSAMISADRSPAPTGVQSSGNGDTGDQQMNGAWDGDENKELSWEDVLPTRGRETRRARGGAALAARLASLHPLGNKLLREESRPLHLRPRISGTTEEPRRPTAAQLTKDNRGALSTMIKSQEDASSSPTLLAAAMLRRTWQDINDTRRRSYAKD